MASLDTEYTKEIECETPGDATLFEENAETEVESSRIEGDNKVANGRTDRGYNVKTKVKKELDGKIVLFLVLILSVLLALSGILFLIIPETIESWLFPVSNQ